MSTVTVVAKVVARKGFVESVRNELLKLVAPTRKEEGCIEYRLHQDNDDPAVFIFYENWKGAGFLERHMNSDHFNTYVSAVEGMIEEKIVNIMTAIE